MGQYPNHVPRVEHVNNASRSTLTTHPHPISNFGGVPAPDCESPSSKFFRRGSSWHLFPGQANGRSALGVESGTTPIPLLNLAATFNQRPIVWRR